MKKIALLNLSALIAALSNTAYAQESITTLETQVVTASGYEQDTTEAPASISVITREELQQNAYRNVGEALEGVPGLMLTGSASGKNIALRGMPADYTLIMVDGRPQSSHESQPSGNAGYDQEWLPPMADIERIEVVRGPMSTLYGSSAMGGVVNIITRKNADKWSGSLRLEAIKADSGDFGSTSKQTLSLSGPLVKDKLSARLSAQLYDRAEDSVSRGSPHKEIDNYSAKLDFTPTDRHQFGLELRKADQTRQTTLGNSAAASARSDSETNNDKKSVALTHTGKYGKVTENSYFQHESTYNTGRDIRITNKTANTSWVIPTDKHTFSVGANLTDAKLEDSTTNGLSDLTTISNNQIALFAEDEWFVSDNFSITAGVRADKNENFDGHFSPRLYGVWLADDNWTLKGGVSSGYRAPELRQMTAEWGQTSRGGDIFGNADLQPETSVSKEIGLLYKNDALSAGLTLFDNRFDDKISLTDCPDSICPDDETARQYINIDEAKTQGAELSAKYAFNSQLSTSLSYTYTDSEQLSGDNKGQPLTQVPVHLAKLSLNWQPLEKTGFWVGLEHHGKESAATGLSSNRETQAPSYNLFDLGMSYQFNKAVALKAGVNNLFDEEFTFEEYGFVDSGREYWATMDIGF